MVFARRMLGNDEDVEDALQEAFCRCWQARMPMKSQADADKVAMTVVRNISIDHLRKKRRQQAEVVDLTVDEASTVNDLMEQRYRAVERIIAERLTPLQQRIIRQHDIEGVGYHDISLREGMTEEAVRQQLSRARKKIRQLYFEQKEDEL